ncbi:MAG: Cna B-type domain-containing protein, partial [Mogibacterium sp.]|nr:Cna B-type domain-containing protein [Mogibacterium sp.]
AKPEEAKAEEEEKAEDSKKTDEYKANLDKVFVKVTVPADAFDQKVDLVVKPLDSKEDKKAIKAAEKELAKNKIKYDGYLAYDIHFENSKGEEVEPDGEVSVEMTAKKKALKDVDPGKVNPSSLQVVHIGSGDTEVVADAYKASSVEGSVEMDATKKTVNSIDATFDVDEFSTFLLTWENASGNAESATIHFVELNEDGTVAELAPSVSLDTSAASVSLSTDFPDIDGKEYRYVAGYYSDEEVTHPADDATNIEVTLKKNADGTWQCTPVLGDAAMTVKNGSHIYASYKLFTKAGNTPATGDASLIKPDSIKNVTDNGDGTYTVRLDINGHQFEEKAGANVLLIFDRTSSMVDNDMGDITRFQAAKNATHTLVNALDPAHNPINMAVMSFARSADADYVDWTEDGEDITDFTDDLVAAPSGSTPGYGGTNWEAAFDMAKDILDDAPANNPTYLVFLTDGNPTIYVGSNTIRTASYTSAEYTRARTEASGVDAAIPIYGILCAEEEEGPLLEPLMDDLATSEYGGHETHYVLADNQTTLTNTFREIGNKILADLGASQASTNDGVTALSTTSATAGAAGAFKYYKTERPSGLSPTQIIPHNQLVPWDNAPAASYSSATGVTWDLESEGLLADNTSYTLEFVVWPSQAAYDLIADLNNGLKVYEPGQPNSITDAERAQVEEGSGGKYFLKTNTNFDTSYSFQDEQYSDTGITQSQGRMPLPTEPLSVEKIWNNILDERNPPTSAELYLTKDGDDYLYGENAIKVSAATGWKAEVFISLGQILQNTTDNTYEILEIGHDYEIEESAASAYQWELSSEIFRPMVINGKVVALIKDNNATGTDGVDYYTIGGNKYKKDSNNSNYLTAWNDRRSFLEFTKKVTGTGADPDDLFPFSVTVTDPRGEDVWFSVQDAQGNTIFDLDTNATAEDPSPEGPTGYYYAPSGSEITMKIKADWNVRFINLRTETTYEINETVSGLPDGYAFVKAEGEVTDDRTPEAKEGKPDPEVPAVDGEKVSGTVNIPNCEFRATYTNKYEETKITATKTWNDNNDQDGKRASVGATVQLYKTVDGTKTAVGDPVNVQTTNGVIKEWTKLPVYEGGKQISYSVEETLPAASGYTKSGDGTLMPAVSPDT